MPYLVKSYDLASFLANYVKVLQETEQVHFRFSKAQWEEIRDRVHEGAADGETFSNQDCLTAYLTTVLTRVLNVPIQRVFNVMNVRAAHPLPGRLVDTNDTPLPVSKYFGSPVCPPQPCWEFRLHDVFLCGCSGGRVIARRHRTGSARIHCAR